MNERRLAVVTGGNRGIGLAIAQGLVARGLSVIATARDEVEGRATAASIGADCHELDVTSDASVERLAQDLRAGFDVLVNNAGTSLDGFDATVARQTLEVNFHGPLRVTDRLLPLARRGARIVMVSSTLGAISCVSPELARQLMSPTLTRAALLGLMAAFVDDVAAGRHEQRGWPTSAYAVSKVGLNALTRILGRELAADPRGILVNAACPGWVRTRMGGDDAPRTPAQGAQTPLWLALLPEGGSQGGNFRDEAPAPW